MSQKYPSFGLDNLLYLCNYWQLYLEFNVSQGDGIRLSEIGALIDDDYFCDFLVSLDKINTRFPDILDFLPKDIVNLHPDHGLGLKSPGYGG